MTDGPYGDVHTLIIRDAGPPYKDLFDMHDWEDWEIVHPPGCPTTDYFWGTDYSCPVGEYSRESMRWTLRYSGTPIDEPGEYKIQAWARVHPSGPWGPAEYDGGLVVAEETS